MSRHLHLLAAALLLLAAACRSTGETAPAPADAGSPAVKSRLGEAEKRERAEAILETILRGMSERNHPLYLTHFTAEMKEKVPAATFTRMVESLTGQLGNYQSRHYLGRVDKQILDVFLWKGKFSKSEEEVVMSLFLGEVDGHYQAFGFGIAPH